MSMCELATLNANAIEGRQAFPIKRQIARAGLEQDLCYQDGL